MWMCLFILKGLFINQTLYNSNIYLFCWKSLAIQYNQSIHKNHIFLIRKFIIIYDMLYFKDNLSHVNVWFFLYWIFRLYNWLIQVYGGLYGLYCGPLNCIVGLLVCIVRLLQTAIIRLYCGLIGLFCVLIWL